MKCRCLAVILSLSMMGFLVTCNQNKVDKASKPDAETQAPTPDETTGPPQPSINGNLPLSVNVPSSVTTPTEARPFFDTFSWQSFIALNWPVSNTRGVPQDPDDPAVFKNAPNGTPSVWGSYREAFDLFGQGENRPPEWDSNETGTTPCDPKGGKLLLMANKGGTLLDGINEAFSFPLIDQNLNYAYTEVRFSKAQYNFVRGLNDDESSWLYRVVNLAAVQRKLEAEGKSLQMPASSPPDTEGSLMIKGTWRELTDGEDQSRYYAVDALLYEPDDQGGGTCRPAKMGLVGLHIVQKLDEFPQWIWSSFEQVDNVPGGQGSQAPYSFNNGTDSPPTPSGWANRPGAKVPPLVPKSERQAVQVTRVNPIPDTPAVDSTQQLNQKYQALLTGTVWQHYQLIITQWPSNPGQFSLMEAGGVYPADSGGAFPENGCTNAVMETYFQTQNDAAGAGGNSCMSCHYRAGQSDYSWVLQTRAY